MYIGSDKLSSRSSEIYIKNEDKMIENSEEALAPASLEERKKIVTHITYKGKKRRVAYACGLPFNPMLAENINALKLLRMKIKKASLIIIDGGLGEGKTTLAVEMADYITGKPIDLSSRRNATQLAMGGQEFIRKLRLGYKKQVPTLIYDEAGDFNKRGALTRFNATINRVFETFRALRIIIILVLPCFGVLDQDLLLKGIPRLLLHCENRKRNYGCFRGYSLERMYYVRDKMNKIVVKPHAYNLVSANFHGEFVDLPPERSRLLDQLSTKSKLEALKDSEVKIEGLVSYYDLAMRLSRSVIWVKKAISELKIPHKRVIDRKKYFDENVINALADYMEQQERKAYERDKKSK